MKDKKITRKNRIIDLSEKRSEYEVNVIVENFFVKAAPMWFKWVGWFFATGAIAYLAQKTDSKFLQVMEAISSMLIGMYFFFFLLSIKIEPIFTWRNKLKSKVEKWAYIFVEIAIFLTIMFWTRTMFKELIDLIIKFK